MWYAGGYVPLLADQLAHLAKAEEMLRTNIRYLRRLKIGDTRAFTTPRRERLIGMAKELADELTWGLLIQRRAYNHVAITRLPHPGE